MKKVLTGHGLVLAVSFLTLFLGIPIADPANAHTSSAGKVVITPLGSHAGEFCRNDRALLFEDPTGVRVLWDPVRTRAGETDSRLGNVHVLVLSSAHSDYIRDVKQNPSSPRNLRRPGDGHRCSSLEHGSDCGQQAQPLG